MQRLSYIRLESAGGDLRGSGTLWGMAAGGERLDVEAQGRLRLPDARLSGTCPAGPCPDPEGRTFLAEGNLSLEGLQRAAPGRLRGALAGEFAGAAFDESPRWEFTAAQAALAMGALAGLAVLAKLALALASHNRRVDVLQHPRRRQVYDIVGHHPGLSYRELQRRLGWANGSLQRHLKSLVAARAVAAQPYRNTVRYFHNHGQYNATWSAVVQLRDGDARQVLALIATRPGLTQNDVLQATATWGWTRAKTRRRLAGLQEAGLVLRQRAGRRVHYHATGP